MTKEKKYLVSIILWSIFFQICWEIICYFWQKRKRKLSNLAWEKKIKEIKRRVRAEMQAEYLKFNEWRKNEEKELETIINNHSKQLKAESKKK